MRGAWALLAALALCAALARAQDVPTCQRLTGIAGCSECRGKTCLYCGQGFGMEWKGSGATLQIARCIPAAGAAKCATATKDKNCQSCVGSTCIACKPTGAKIDKRLVWAAGASFGKCVVGTPAQITGNRLCTKFNPDGSCTQCANVNPGSLRQLVTPLNAMYTNGIYPLSMCNTTAQLGVIYRAAFGGAMPPLPEQCTEVGADLGCQRCLDGYSLRSRGTLCAKNPSSSMGANGCKVTTPWQQYCEQCAAGGLTCRTCVPGRSVEGGQCRLSCKQRFGITCAACTATACIKNDPAFPNGRR